MKDVSNKLIAVLVLVAIAFSAVESWLVIEKLTGTSAPSSLSGAVTGTARVNVTPVLSIRLAVNTVDFGQQFQNSTNDTTNNVPPPFLVENDGNVFANVSINGSVLFTGTGGGNNTDSFQIKADNSSELGSFNGAASVVSFRNVSTSPINDFIAQLNSADATDTAEVDVKIRIPVDEPAGVKTSTLDFVAEQS